MLMQTVKPLGALENPSEFIARHIGIDAADEAHMLSVVGAASRQALIAGIVPRSIARSSAMNIPAAVTEAAALKQLKAIAAKNQVFKSHIGQGYHGSYLPGVILRNILENPAWYTAYTPYQPEISQGRLEALINFQTMVADLTGMAIANASMLDEATAAAEAMTLARRSVKRKSNVFIVAGDCHPQTIEVIQTRATPLGIEVRISSAADTLPQLMAGKNYFGVLAQYPATTGSIHDLRPLASQVHADGAIRIRRVGSRNSVLAVALKKHRQVADLMPLPRVTRHIERTYRLIGKLSRRHRQHRNHQCSHQHGSQHRYLP